MKASENTKDQCEDFHQPQEYEAQQVQGISGAEGVGLVSLPEKLDEPVMQEAIVSMVRSQLSCCAQAKGSVVLRLRDQLCSG